MYNKGWDIFLYFFILIPIGIIIYQLFHFFDDYDGDTQLSQNDIYQNEVIDAYNSIDEGDTKDSIQRKLGHLVGVYTYVFDGVKYYKNNGETMEVYCYRWLLNWYPPVKNGPRAYILVYFDKEHRYVDKDHFGVDSSRYHVKEG